MCDVELAGVVNAPDASNLYEVPLILHEEGLDRYVCEILGLANLEPDLSSWSLLVERIERATSQVRIGIIGKYVSLPDAYMSVVEALRHGGYDSGANVEIDWIQAEDVEGLLADGRLGHLDGMIIPGGFGERGVEGKIAAARYAREHEIPCLGDCPWPAGHGYRILQESAGISWRQQQKFDPTTAHPVVDLMDSQRDVTDLGGTMRLGLYPARLLEGSKVAALYEESLVYERHRHRYEVNNDYRAPIESEGLKCSGLSPDGRLVEFIELEDHPYWGGNASTS